MVSPASYSEPSGFSQNRWFSGHASMNPRLASMARAVRGRNGNPSPAYSMARADTCSKLMVPQRSSTVNAPCRAPGTTAGSRPSPRRSRPRDSYHSMLAPFGAHPWATTDVTSPSAAG